ncbi:hydrogenase maturation nickel metallochaperone HypA [soil metagenome]
MHELGLCESILDAVEKRAAGRRVTAMRIKVGTLHRVPGEAFRSAFEVISTGSVAHGADIDFVVLPVRMHCRGCGRNSRVDDLLGACPACGAPDVVSDGGDELVLDSICTAESPTIGRS